MDAAPADPRTLDPFFAGDADVLKSYAFDYDKIIAYEKEILNSSILGSTVSCLPLTPCILLYHFDCERANVIDLARAKHLAITRDGIKYVVAAHDTGCRREDERQGQVSKTIPYDKITDCDIEEPAGSEGCCPCYLVPNTLVQVQIDTASGNRESGKHELSVKGLKDAESFKKDVWAMKRGEQVSGVVGTVAPMAVSMRRCDAPKTVEQQLVELKGLLEKGLVTQEHHDKLKMKCLDTAF